MKEEVIYKGEFKTIPGILRKKRKFKSKITSGASTGAPARTGHQGGQREVVVVGEKFQEDVLADLFNKPVTDRICQRGKFRASFPLGSVLFFLPAVNHHILAHPGSQE